MKCRCGFFSENVIHGPWVNSGDDEEHAKAWRERERNGWIRLQSHLRVCPKCGAVYVQMNQDGYIDKVSDFLKAGRTV